MRGEKKRYTPINSSQQLKIIYFPFYHPSPPLPVVIGILSNLSHFSSARQVTGKSPGILWPCLGNLHSQVSAIQTYAVDNGTQRRKDTRTYLAVHTIIIIGQLIRAALDIWCCPSRHFVVFVVETAFNMCAHTHWNLDNYPCKQQSLWQWWQVEGQGSFNGVFCPWCILGQTVSWPLHPAWNNITFTPHPLNQPSLSKHDCDRFWCKSLSVDISHHSSYFCLLISTPPELSISKCLEVVWQLILRASDRPIHSTADLILSSSMSAAPPPPVPSAPQEANNLLPVYDTGRGGKQSPCVKGVNPCAHVHESTCMRELRAQWLFSHNGSHKDFRWSLSV